MTSNRPACLAHTVYCPPHPRSSPTCASHPHRHRIRRDNNATAAPNCTRRASRMLRNAFDLRGRAGWGQRYRELVEYREAHGDCCVPKAQGTLGRWVARQRELRKKKALSSDREAKLQALGFVWNTNDSAWDARFEQLKEWKDRQGHACVPIAEGDLGVWVAKQRQLKRKEKLAPHRETRLDSINFVWDTPNTDWNEKYQALARWKTVCGDCRVPFNEGELGWWVNTQRQSKRKGKLSKEREDRLNEIGFIWNPQGVPPSSSNNPPTSNAEPSGATRSTSSGGAGSKRRSEDRSSLGGSSSKRHHSFSSNDSSAHNSFSYLPAPNSGSGFLSAPHRSSLHGASGNSTSASSMDELYTRERDEAGFSSGAWRGGTSPSTASVASSDQVLPPLNIGDSGTIVDGPPLLPSLYGVEQHSFDKQHNTFNPVLPSLSVPGPSFTSSTTQGASQPSRSGPFERLPSVHTLAPQHPAPFQPRRVSGGTQAPSARISSGKWASSLSKLEISASPPLPSPRSAHGSVAVSPRTDSTSQQPFPQTVGQSQSKGLTHSSSKTKVSSLLSPSPDTFEHSPFGAPSPGTSMNHERGPFGAPTAGSSVKPEQGHFPTSGSAVKHETQPFRAEMSNGQLGEPFGFAQRWGSVNGRGS